MKIVVKPDCEPFDRRFIIVDENDNLLDDAQGYGYKTREKAARALWYKFKGGRRETNRKNQRKTSFYKQHPGIRKFVDKIYENNFKEISRGEVTNQDIILAVNEEFGVDLPEEYL